jgi:hypothetical protein
MLARQWNRRLARFLIIVALTALGLLGVRPTAAADLSQLDTSLKLIPADAAFYSSMLRNREQIEAIKKSKAWAKIMDMPVVQWGLSMYNMQAQSPGTGPAKVEEVLQNPETRKVVDLASEMASDEIFIYGDKNFADVLELIQNAVSASRYGPLVMQMTQKEHGKHRDMQAAAVISAVAEDAKLIAVPNLVVGFKVKNTELAKEQLIKLEAIANVLLGMNEKTKGHFKKTKVAGEECLVLELDGSMIPWDEVPLDELKEKEAEEGDVQKIVDRVKQSKLVITLGVRGNYVLATIGSSVAPLEKLGKGERLIDRPEFKPLAKFADRRLVSIGYVSEALNQQVNRQQKDIDELLEFVNLVLPESPLSAEQKERIGKDAKLLADDLKSLMPKQGAMLGLSFLTDRGVEGYQYSWGEHRALDGSQPLGLLQHVGGSPLLGVVARNRVNIADYEMLVKWAKVGYGYFKEFALPTIPAKDREKADKFLEAALPLVERLDKANREMIWPALADGQVAFVVDGKLSSSHFLDKVPATEKPMPMAEPALVIGVSNADLLKKGLGEYRAIVNGLIDAARKTSNGEIPENVVVPEPQVTEIAGGKAYSYPLPAAWGVDKKIVPNLGLGEKVAVVTLTHDHTARLLTATPLSVGGLLEKADRPLAAAVWFRWAGLLDAGGPWIDFAVDQVMANNMSANQTNKEAVLGQVHTVVEVLKTLRTVTDESYLEDGVLVNHTLVEVHDLEK